jgi:hypothetical protein
MPATPANLAKVVGQPLKRALRKLEEFRPWHYDPELELAAGLQGFPDWAATGGYLADTGESAAEFMAIVGDYVREMESGSVFPPLLVARVTPAADRADLGPAGYWLVGLGKPPSLRSDDHQVVVNGRHRAVAAWKLGARTFLAYVLAPLAQHGRRPPALRG